MLLVKDLGTLSAPGSTAPLYVGRLRNHTLQYIVANINTNIVLKVEGSLDPENTTPASINWFNLAENNDTFTIITNITDAFASFSALNWIRLTFVSETGGTDATIAVKYCGLSQGGV